jgi:hypothetical protein
MAALQDTMAEMKQYANCNQLDNIGLPDLSMSPALLLHVLPANVLDYN